jgi:hypothetical protein
MESGIECEAGWSALCKQIGDHRYVEMIDRQRRCYARLALPSEQFYVWFRGKWMPASENDNYGHWEPVTSQYVQMFPKAG